MNQVGLSDGAVVKNPTSTMSPLVTRETGYVSLRKLFPFQNNTQMTVPLSSFVSDTETSTPDPT